MAEEEEKTADDAPAAEAEPQNDDAAGETPREAADEAADVHAFLRWQLGMAPGSTGAQA